MKCEKCKKEMKARGKKHRASLWLVNCDNMYPELRRITNIGNIVVLQVLRVN